MYSLVILTKATEETSEIYNYYEFISEGFGERFLEQVDICIELLKKNPFIFQKAFEEKRQAIVDIYSVVIIYEVKEQTIYIYSVFHTSRNPDDKFIN